MTHNNIPFINPATNAQFGSVTISSIEDIRSAYDHLHNAQEFWKCTPIERRLASIKQLNEIVIERLDEIAATISNSTGKPRQDGLTETFVYLNLSKDIIKNGPRWLGKQRIPTGLQFFKRAYTFQKPYGIVAVISPWNYPFTLTMIPIISALATGNSVIAKTSENTPSIGCLVESLISEVPQLSDNLRFVHGDGRVGAEMIKRKPDLIHVTGSVRTGKIIAKAAAEELIPVILELGGKDPVIVLEDADLEAAAKWISWGGFFNSGQTCMSPERVYVVEKVYDQFRKLLVEKTRKIQVGFTNDTESPYSYGSITTKMQADIVTEQLRDAVENGAKLHTGGLPEGMFMQPTVIDNVKSGMKIIEEETFGAVLPLIKVKNAQEAVKMANQHHMGLSASVWSENLHTAKNIAEKLEVGSVNINDTMSHYGVPQLPFGGVKQSGYGKVMGKEGLLSFSRTTSVVHGKPLKYDLSTIIRTPQKYRLNRCLMKVTVGSNSRQRLEGLKEMINLLLKPRR